MVNAMCVEHWLCEECGESYDHEEEAEECCKNEVEEDENM